MRMKNIDVIEEEELFYTADIAIAIVSNCNISIESTYSNSLSTLIKI